MTRCETCGNEVQRGEEMVPSGNINVKGGWTEVELQHRQVRDSAGRWRCSRALEGKP